MLRKVAGTIAPCTILCLVLLGIGASVQADSSTKMTAQTTAAKAAVEGTITTVELDGTIVVKPASGAAVLMYARAETKISRNGQPAMVKDLRAGDTVWAQYVPESRSAVEVRATGK